jgi:hypothetical protein
VLIRLCISILLLGVLFPAQGRTMPDAPAEIPFQFREGLIWVKVRVSNSDEPLNFLLDTGAGVSVIDWRTMTRLGLKAGRKVLVRGVQNTVDGFWPVHAKATLDGIPLPKDFLAVDLDALSRACKMPVHGLIGADFFRGRTVQIDFVEEKIRPLNSYRPSANAEALPLEIRPCGMCVPVAVNGGLPQRMRLDTGCASAFQWVTANVRLDQCSSQMAIGLAAVSVPQASATVRLGTSTFENVPAGIHEKAIFCGESGLLGNGLLSRFRSVIVDAKEGRVVLQK